MTKLKVFVSSQTDPFINLAIEDKLLRSHESDYILFFYSNRSSIIMGHFQDPWKECNLKLMNEDSIPLVRRQSGGGAIYSDEQCLNYSFMAPKKIFDPDIHFRIFQNVFQTFSIEIKRDKYHSLFIDEFKFSGAAFKNIKDRSLHHGTLLLQGDEAYISKILTSSVTLLESRSTDSNPSKIKTLLSQGLPIEKKLWIELISRCSSDILTHIDELPDVENIESFDLEISDRFRQLNWVYGITPYTKFQIGDLLFVIKKGVVVEVDGVSCQVGLERFRNKEALPFGRATISKIEKVLDYFLLR